MSPAALELKDVHAAYGKIEVVHGVDLCVESGHVLALFGPNGAGKSTILKVAGGGLKPTIGSVLLKGTNVSGIPSHRLTRSGLCWIPEGRGIFANLTVSENLMMWTYRGKPTRSAVEESAFARFPVLADRRRQLAGTLSGGEQQMLAMARALVGNPAVLLVDELSMGLAPKIVSELYEVVGQIASGGVAVLLVEQFAHAALHVATDAALIVQGGVAMKGSPDDVAAAAHDAYLATQAGTSSSAAIPVDE